jgi:Right handed beta helix region
VRKTYSPIKIFFLVISLSSATISPFCQTIRYVKTISSGTGDGSSWANSSSNLQTTINASAVNDEVWVAAGAYQLASGQFYTMKAGVKIYGGFSGTEMSLSQRNWEVNVTTLSGNNNSVIRNNNNGLTSSAVLDGFTITNGNVDKGGGIYNYGYSNPSPSPTISNCIFQNNYANSGAGIYNEGPNTANISNCIFSNNTANTGGGIHNDYYSSPVIANCTFKNNQVSKGGGVYSVFYTNAVINNCTFNNNNASFGGGIYCDIHTNTTVNNSAFYGNHSTWGGGVHSVGVSVAIKNCTFFSNTLNAGGNGGGISIGSSGTGNIGNCILWNNGGSDAYTAGATITVTYSIVDGGFSGVGNLNTNPLFVNALSPDGADAIPRTADDGLRFCGLSPALNAGSNAAAPAIVTTDITGAARIQQDIVDIGAYEGSILKTVTWLGLTNNWSSASNWSNGIVPDACTSVIVNGSAPFMPVVNSNQTCYMLTATNGATINIAVGANLQIVGK